MSQSAGTKPSEGPHSGIATEAIAVFSAVTVIVASGAYVSWKVF